MHLEYQHKIWTKLVLFCFLIFSDIYQDNRSCVVKINLLTDAGHAPQ